MVHQALSGFQLQVSARVVPSSIWHLIYILLSSINMFLGCAHLQPLLQHPSLDRYQYSLLSLFSKDLYPIGLRRTRNIYIYTYIYIYIYLKKNMMYVFKHILYRKCMCVCVCFMRINPAMHHPNSI